MKITKQIFLIIIFSMVSANILFAQNYKIRQTVSMNGQKTESTVYVKGSRKRTENSGIMGMGGDVADVEQCDLRRNLKISDKKKSYFVEPFQDDADDSAQTPKNKPATPVKNAPSVKGGTVTLIYNSNDTGERKQMFGITARHIKTSMKMEASPDACMKGGMNIETDGWYIDLPDFSCPMSRPETPQMPVERGSQGGCRDRMIYKSSGSGKVGFALQETRTMSNGGMSFTQSTETIEFSRAALDAALFDIPAGYSLTQNSDDLYSKPDYTAMAKAMGKDDDEKGNPTISKNDPNPSFANPLSKPKAAGVIRIGVYAPTNKSEENVSAANLQAFLIQKLTNGNVEAISISSEAEAQAANCDYVLNSDFSKIKQSAASKIGGIFGKVTNTDTSATRNYDVQVDFKLVSLKDGKTTSNKANYKGQGSVDQAAENALNQEAVQVMSVVK